MAATFMAANRDYTEIDAILKAESLLDRYLQFVYSPSKFWEDHQAQEDQRKPVIIGDLNDD